MKKLFLDDIRHPGDVTWVDINIHSSDNSPWETVRSYAEAIEWVLKNGCPDIISFDHDLGYLDEEVSSSGLHVVTNAMEEKSGYDFTKWLVNRDMDYNIIPYHFKFVVHSKNQTGAENIYKYLSQYLKLKFMTGDDKYI